MTKKQFWQTASNWGFLTGAGLFAMNLIGWGFKLETSNSWLYELLLLIVIFPAIIYTGKKNARNSSAEGYGYGQAVGFVLAMMMFAGIVYGVGRFLIINFMGVEYYSALNETVIDNVFLVYRNIPQFNSMMEMRGTILGWLGNPFYLIFEGVIGMVFRGGFLGLILCTFVYKRPEMFPAAQQTQNDGNQTE
jgi:uncharacterized membrane protein SirB2